MNIQTLKHWDKSKQTRTTIFNFLPLCYASRANKNKKLYQTSFLVHLWLWERAGAVLTAKWPCCTRTHKATRWTLSRGLCLSRRALEAGSEGLPGWEHREEHKVRGVRVTSRTTRVLSQEKLWCEQRTRKASPRRGEKREKERMKWKHFGCDERQNFVTEAVRDKRCQEDEK